MSEDVLLELLELSETSSSPLKHDLKHDSEGIRRILHTPVESTNLGVIGPLGCT